MEEDQYYTIATFIMPLDFDMARLTLEAEEIPYRVRDEYTVQVDNFLSNAVGGIKLQVPQKDMERARELLIRSGHLPDQDEKPGWLENTLGKPSSLRRARQLLAAILIIIALSFIVAVYYFSK
jgi:hypothetical protein